MRYALLIMCFMLQNLLMSQATLSVDQTQLRIGDQLHATVQLQSTMGGEWINKDKIWPDSMNGIELVSGPTIREGDDSGMEATYTLAFFDTGFVRIPALPVVIEHQGRTDTFYTLDIPIKVLPVEPDSSGLLAIKDIYKEPFNLAYYRRYIPHLIIFAVLLAALVYWWKKRKKEPVYVETAPAPLSPQEWAMQALDELSAMGLWQQGEIKEHYTRLTSILREYLERKYAIHALEQTSDEIVDQLRQMHLHTELLQDTAQLLSVADLIKFAKADPGTDIHAETIERVRTFVAQTSDTPASVLGDNKTTSHEDLG